MEQLVSLTSSLSNLVKSSELAVRRLDYTGSSLDKNGKQETHALSLWLHPVTAELGREPVGSPSDKPIHTAVYALIRDFQAIPDAGPIFVGGEQAAGKKVAFFFERALEENCR